MSIQGMVNMLKRNNGEEGFTLVELLIVVAIIAILAAIAIPQFSQYRKRGYAATLNADAKNGYTAAQAYLTDNPSITTVDCAAAAAGGARPSSGVTCTGTMTTASGAFTFTGAAGWGLSTNTSVITYSGSLTPAAA